MLAQTQASASADRAHIEEVLKGLSRGRSLGQVAISPDGKRLAWIEGAREGAEIRVAPLGDLAKSERVTAATKPEQHCHEGQIAWSPNAQSLLFFSDCAKPDQPDLYLSLLDGSPARRLTELKGYVEAPAFSPDGTRVAFLYVEGATRPAGALAAMKPPSGVIGEDGVEIERVAVVPVRCDKLSLQGWLRPQWRLPPICTYTSLIGGRTGRGLAYIAADPPGENNWWVAKLYTQELNGEPRAILAPAEISGPLHGLQIAVPRWSPDGKQIAFIGGLMSDQGVTGGDVWIIPATGGQPVDLTPGRPSSPAWIEWDGNETSLSPNWRAGMPAGPFPSSRRHRLSESLVYELQRAHLQHSRQRRRRADGDESFLHRRPFAVRISRQQLRPAAGDLRAPSQAAPPCTDPPDLAGLHQLSHINDGVKPAWGKSDSLTWKSGKFDVQGWLMLPKDYDPAKKYPLIVVGAWRAGRGGGVALGLGQP